MPRLTGKQDSGCALARILFSSSVFLYDEARSLICLMRSSSSFGALGCFFQRPVFGERSNQREKRLYRLVRERIYELLQRFYRIGSNRRLVNWKNNLHAGVKV